MIEAIEPRQYFATNFLDTNFGGAGVATFRVRIGNYPNGEYAVDSQIKVDASKNTYVLAKTLHTVQLRRLDADGVIDTNWFASKNGLLLFPISTGNISVQMELDSADRVLLKIDQTIYRFTAAGALDTTFASGGKLVLADFRNYSTFDVDPGNRIVVTGFQNRDHPDQTLVERFISRGRFDKTFDADGKASIPLPAGANLYTEGEKVRVLASGDIMVGSRVVQTNRGVGAQSARLNSDGSLDTGYATNGTVYIQAMNLNDLTTTDTHIPKSIMPDGSVSIDGVTEDQIGISHNYAMIRPDGTIAEDQEYSILTADPEPDGGALRLTLLTQVQRVLSDGSLETSFNGGRKLFGVRDIELDGDQSVYITTLSTVGKISRVSVARFVPGIDPQNT